MAVTKGLSVCCLLAAAWCLALLPVWAQNSGAMGELVPLSAQAPEVAPVATALRGPHLFWTWATQADRELLVKAEACQLGRYTDGLVLTYPGDKTAKVVAKADLGETAELRFRPGKTGLVSFSANAGANVYRFLTIPQHLAVEVSPTHPLHLVGGGELFFFVPAGALKFTVAVWGQSKAETARAAILDPSGREVASAEALKGTTARLTARPASSTGKVWKLVLSKASEGIIEDVFLALEGDVAPYVFLAETGALVPFCYGLNHQPTLLRSVDDAVLRVGLTAPNLAPGSSLVLRLEQHGKLLQQAQTAPGETQASIKLPNLASAAYQVKASLLDTSGAVLTATTAPVEVRNGILYTGGVRPLLDLALSYPKTPDSPVEARLALEGMEGAELFLSAELYRCGLSEDPLGPEAVRIATQEPLERREGLWTAVSSAPLADGTYEWLFKVRCPDSPQPVSWQRTHWVVNRGEVLPEVGPTTTLPPCSGMWETGPVALAVPQVQDAMPYGYLPSPEDLTRPLATAAAQGESRSAVAVLIATRDVAAVSASLSDLKGPKGASLTSSLFDFRVARYWAQRTSWRSGNCWIVPELLEEKTSWALRELQPSLLWLTLHVPLHAPPGLYRGKLTITADAHRLTRPVEVQVYPFELAAPQEYHWGLYTDSSRWRTYNEAKIEAEMRDYVSHGITSLMMYPLKHSTVELVNDRLRINAGDFVRYMNLARECGLRPPTVFSFQDLETMTNRLIDAKRESQEKWDQVARDIVLHFDRLARAADWGEVVYHTIDEPHGPGGEGAVHLLSLLKGAGLTTFTTALDLALINGPLDPYVDVRCWSVSFVLGSGLANQKARADCEKSGDRLWYYGSGSYQGQEGSMLPNRWITGCGLWISGAEGGWSWTFLRPKDDAFNDFDGEGHREAKDAMIVYPTEGDGPPLPTTQWEGIRHGANDFRYLYTARAAASRLTGDAGRRAQEELDRLTAEMPWSVRPADVDSETLDAWRERAARLIVRCR